ncbi:MAG: hypothetical protein GEU68_01405 [Actinobacteria bacterium]|nr:hypothetical protein [Actinomycetota bacterium]
MTDLDRELKSMLRARSDDAHPSPAIPPATLRKARIQRAMVGVGTCAAVVALGIGGFLAATGADRTPDGTHVATPQVVASEDPARFASGKIEDTRWSLAARATADGICVTVEETTESARSSSADSNTLCGISGDDLSLTQVSFDGVDPVLVFGTVPSGAQSAELVLEDGSTKELRLRLRGRVMADESYYVAVVDDAATEGAVVVLERDGTEMDRRGLCAPRAPQMLNRRGINVPLFCGDGRG